MWETPNISRAINEFISTKHQFPENAFLFLPDVIEETPVCKGKIYGATSTTGRELMQSFQAYSDFYRQNSISEVTEDRFIKTNRGPKLYSNCYTALINHCNTYYKNNEWEIVLYSWMPVIFAMAVMGMLTSMLLIGYVDEDKTDEKLKRQLFEKSESSARYSAEQFGTLVQQLQELEGALRTQTQGNIGSLIITSLLGFGGAKVFSIVMDFAAGKSPYQNLSSIIATIDRLRICERRSSYTANWMKENFLD